MSERIHSIRGMHDILPDQTPVWQALEARLVGVLAGYGYAQIRLPIVERTELFKRSIGEVTDIVEKEMYTFLDRNGDSLSLRPEGTAGCVRAGIQHGLLHNRQQRLWYLGPMFRHERPQKGRYRQFHQLGAEAFGMVGPDIDVELITLTARLWRALGLDGLRLELNTLGDAQARARYRERLMAHFGAQQERLDEDSRRRLHENPLRILDSKNPAMAPLIESAPRLVEELDEASRVHYQGVKAGLDEAGIPYTENTRLVRGLDYYNRTVFEWVSESLGAQGTVCAGGRYDTLVAQLGGRPTPAAGFAIGLERLLELLRVKGVHLAGEPLGAYLVMAGELPERQGRALSERLRDALPGLRLVANCGGGSFKAQLKRADRSGARLALILGDSEAAAGVVGVKFLRADRPQETVAQDELVAYLSAELGQR